MNIPNTNFTLELNIPDSFKIIDERLFAYNKLQVPATQNPEVIDKNYLVKDGENIIAGICADIYIWKILFIGLIFVEEKYRKQGLGHFLMNKVEEDARALDVKLAHTDTFDFQAKDFYLKHGYEVFGVLDECPPGHQRFYLKKLL